MGAVSSSLAASDLFDCGGRVVVQAELVVVAAAARCKGTGGYFERGFKTGEELVSRSGRWTRFRGAIDSGRRYRGEGLGRNVPEKSKLGGEGGASRGKSQRTFTSTKSSPVPSRAKALKFSPPIPL